MVGGACYGLRVSDQRKGGAALIAGTIGMTVTMVLHPTGRELSTPEGFAARAWLAAAVHALAIASLPLLFAGGLALTRRLDRPDRTALLALIVFGFALVGAMIAAATSGFIAPRVLGDRLGATGAERAIADWLVDFSAFVNQAFAKIHVVGSSIAIGLWSIAILRANAGIARGIAFYGLVAAVGAVAGVLAGLPLGVHNMGVVVVAQAVWFVAVAMQMRAAGRS